MDVKVSTHKNLQNPFQNSHLTKEIRQIWERLLNQPRIDDNDNFFALGGHSLTALELSDLLKTEMGYDINLRDIFENPTIESLASVLISSKPRLPLRNSKIPHIELQEGILSHKTRVHHLPTSLRIKWDLDPILVKKSLEFLIERHPSLRTCIVENSGLMKQRILTTETALREEANVPFLKGSAPLFRAKLYQLGPTDFSLFIMAHHYIWDGWCFDIFFDEFDCIYSAYTKNTYPTFKRNPGVTYLDYTQWFHAKINAGAFDGQVKY